MGNVSEPVESKYNLSKENINRMELEMLRFSGLPQDWIWQTDVKVGKHDNEPVYI